MQLNLGGRKIGHNVIDEYMKQLQADNFKLRYDCHNESLATCFGWIETRNLSLTNNRGGGGPGYTEKLTSQRKVFASIFLSCYIKGRIHHLQT